MPTPARINMAEAIQGAWEHVVVTSFGVDLGFFERAILPQLAQTRGRLILADADHLLAHEADAARGRLVRHLNRGYHAGGVHVAGVAHAKMILLLSETRGRLLVGSGNLRLTGWGSTGEMFTQYDLSDQDTSYLAAFTAARRFLDGLASRHLLDGFSRAYLEQVWTRVSWLGEDGGADGPVRHNLERPILDQFVEAVDIVGERPKELIMLAPFHDGRCEAIKELLERTEPRQATLLVQPGRTSVDPDALRRVMASHPGLAVKPFGPRGDHDRYVHAKVVLARFKKRSICLQGSANLSRAALMTTIPDGNVEMVNLLEGAPGAFDHLLSDLWIGKAEADVSMLDVSFQSEPSLVELTGPRILEAIWDGELLTLLLSEPISSAGIVWLTMGTALVEAEVVNRQAAPNREGAVVVSVRPVQDVDEQFARAAPVALYLGELPPDENVGESDFTDPVFCVNQPVLIERLEDRPAAVRLRDVGLMALDDDRELEELLQALQSSMVYDRRTLMEVAPPPVPTDDDPTDDQLRIAYADVDYEELRRSHARLHQYEGALLSPGSSALGPIPTDIQLALRSITDAFGDVVGQPERTAGSLSFASEWGTEDESADGLEDPALIEENTEELEAVDGADGELEDPEEVADRRWTNDARMRVHWRNFIDRFLRGLESPAWQELVGTAVLCGNYELFSHVLQRLHRQRWQNFEFMEFLLQATVATHGFVWGRPGETEAGWLSSLSASERQAVVSAFSERHLGVRLLVDLAAASELTHPDTFSGSSRLLDERRGARDVARAVLTNGAWTELVQAEPRFVTACEAVASELCAGDDFACWLEPPSFDTLLDRIDELVSFTTLPEFQQDIASLVGLPAQVVVGQVELLPEGKKVISQDLGIERFSGELDLEMALGLMGRFMTLHPGPRYRVHAGRARLLFDRESGELEWVASLDEDVDLDERELPVIESPWSSSIQALRALGHSAAREAVA